MYPEVAHRIDRPTLAWIIAALGPVYLLHWPFAPTWVVPACTAILSLRVLAPGRWRKRRVWRTLSPAMALAAVVAVAASFHTLLGRDAGVTLLLLLAALKLLETETVRDGRIGVLLAILATNALFLFDQALWRVLLGGALFIVQVGALVQLSAPDENAPLRQRLGEALWLTAAAMPFMLVLFVLFPRVSGPLWHGPQEDIGRSGLPDEMTPGRIARLIRDDSPAFRVRFDDTPPPAASRYWRGPVMSAFDGHSWRVSLLDRAPARDEPMAGSIGEQEVLLEPHGKHWLFGLDRPLQAEVEGMRTHSDMLLAGERILHPLRYRVRSRITDHDGRPLDPAQRRLSLALPAQSAPRAVALAQRWRTAAREDGDVIRMALGYFHHNLRYTLTPGATPPGADPTDHFLFESRAGFCEHMASSFAVLMRAAGIPARVVAGYQGGSWNPIGGFLEVRQSDAHAWTEVWLSDSGWTRIDPTAAIAPERVERGIAAAPGMAAQLPLFARTRLGGGMLATLQAVWDNVNYQWQRWVLAYGPDRQWALLRRLGFDRPDWRHLAWILGAGVGLLAAAFTSWALRSTRPSPQDPLRRVWGAFTRKLARSGVEACPGDTPLEVAARAARIWPEHADRLRRIAEDYVTLRYGPGPVGARETRCLRRRIRRLRLPRLRRRCAGTSDDADDCGPGAGPPREPRVDWRNRPG